MKFGCLMINLFWFLLFQGCQNGSLKPEEYINAVNDSAKGLITKKEFDELTFKLQYQPAAYKALESLDSLPANHKSLQRRIEEKADNHHFVLSIESNSNESLLKRGNPSSEEYQERVQYFAFDMQKDIKLVQGRDTLACSGYHFVRTYNARPGKRFLLEFPKYGAHEGKDKSVVIDGMEGFAKDAVLRINGRAIQKFPELKIQSS